MRRDPFADVPDCPHALPLPRVVPCAPNCDVVATGAHVPGCPWFDPGCDGADHGPPDVGPLADEYDWLVPYGPEDPDRLWGARDSGE